MAQLTPEKRRQIYEEQTRLDAREPLERDHQARTASAKAQRRGNYWRGIGVIAAVIFGITIVSSILSPNHPSEQAAPSSPATSVPPAPSPISGIPPWQLHEFSIWDATVRGKPQRTVYVVSTREAGTGKYIAADPFVACVLQASEMFAMFERNPKLGWFVCVDDVTGDVYDPDGHLVKKGRGTNQ